LVGGRNLADAQVAACIGQLVDADVAVETKADFLGALARKGETPEEIAAFVRELRARSVQPELSPELRAREILDVVGTGGDRLSTFNISTTVAIVASAAGVLVAKHGNRGSTSPVGSADVMEALGLPFDNSPEEAAALLRDKGFAYFFAPRYHPAFRHIGPARKLCAQRGQTTIFNYLGPLLNPACPSAMLIGVPRPQLCRPLARVLQSIGVRRAMVVCGQVPGVDGAVCHLDEISPLAVTHLAEFSPGAPLSESELSPRMFPLQPVSLADLRGGDREVNASIIRRVVGGEERGPKRDAVLLNAAAALFIARAVPNLRAGWDLAEEVIDSGRARAKLRELSQAGA
jgi:anthranilate phosphoribosyltransferase